MRLPGSPVRWRFQVAQSRDVLDEQIGVLRRTMVRSFGILGLGLIMLAALQAVYGLWPLRRVRRAIAAIRSGQKSRIDERLPREIEPLVEELNALLEHNEIQAEEARRHAGNLAHALKTPLTVITNAATAHSPDLGRHRDAARRRRCAARSITISPAPAPSAAAPRAHARAPVWPSLEAVERAVVAALRERHRRPRRRQASATVRVERQDLDEMLGNLIENAAKYGGGRVFVTVKATPECVEIEVEDDGRGIPEAERAVDLRPRRPARHRQARHRPRPRHRPRRRPDLRRLDRARGERGSGRPAGAAQAAAGGVTPLAFAALPAHIAAPMTATVHPARCRTAPPSLDPMVQLVAADLNHVNAVILERMQSEVALIPELAGHLIAGGGKRMRPMLTLACARLLDYPGTRHHKLAAAVEFIHTATLLHDDVVDGSGLRRGKRTANIIWGNPASVLVGDFLFSRSFELMVEDGSLKVLRILSRASRGDRRGRGQPAHRPAPGRDQRGPLSRDHRGQDRGPVRRRLPDRRGGRRARARRSEQALDAYGRNLGIAFQLVDDAIDYASDAATMGKGVGDDFRDGKVTLPVILAYARGDDDDAASGATRWPGAAPRTRIWPTRPACCADSARSTTRSTAPAITASARSTRSAPSRAGRAKAALIEAVEFAIRRAY